MKMIAVASHHWFVQPSVALYITFGVGYCFIHAKAMREAILQDKAISSHTLFFIRFHRGIRGLNTFYMAFTNLDKREVILAMKFMIEADGINHPSEKALFDCIYNSLNISNEEGLAIMNYFKEAKNDMVISLKKHLDTIGLWTLEKRKDLISILTVTAFIDKNLDNRENRLLEQYRIACGLDYNDYSMLDAMQDAKKHIIR